jgi:hypothetical protein
VKNDLNAMSNRGQNFVEYRLKVSTSCSLLHHVMSLQAQDTTLASMTPPLRIYRDKKAPFVSLSAENLPADPESSSSIRRQSKARIVTQDSEFNKNIASSLGDDIFPWILEDADGDHSFVGKREKSQENNYVFFVNQGSSFLIVPVCKWYRFSPKSFQHANSPEDKPSLAGEKQTLHDFIGSKDGQDSPRAILMSHMDEMDYQETFDDDEELGFDEEQLYGNVDDPSAPIVSSRRLRHLSNAGERLKKIVSSIDRDAVEVDSDQDDEGEEIHPGVQTTASLPHPQPVVQHDGAKVQPSSPQKAKRQFKEVSEGDQPFIISEEAVTRLLKSGPMKTKDLISHFRNELGQPHNKQIFRDIVKKVAAVTSHGASTEADKLLVLKAEYANK